MPPLLNLVGGKVLDYLIIVLVLQHLVWSVQVVSQLLQPHTAILSLQRLACLAILVWVPEQLGLLAFVADDPGTHSVVAEVLPNNLFI